MSVTIYHNPRCSKSRQTLQLLRDNGVEPEIIDYLNESPTASTLAAILKKLGLSARDLMRKKEAIYKDLQLAAVESEEKLITAMTENPILIERPIVLANGKAALGRPPESVLEIL